MEIGVNSLVSARTGEPVVEMSVDGRPLQMTIGQARSIAMQLIEAAEAAQSDAMIYEILADAPTAARVGMLQRMRELRDRKLGSDPT